MEIRALEIIAHSFRDFLKSQEYYAISYTDNNTGHFIQYAFDMFRDDPHEKEFLFDCAYTRLTPEQQKRADAFYHEWGETKKQAVLIFSKIPADGHYEEEYLLLFDSGDNAIEATLDAFEKIFLIPAEELDLSVELVPSHSRSAYNFDPDGNFIGEKPKDQR